MAVMTEQTQDGQYRHDFHHHRHHHRASYLHSSVVTHAPPRSTQRRIYRQA